MNIGRAVIVKAVTMSAAILRDFVSSFKGNSVLCCGLQWAIYLDTADQRRSEGLVTRGRELARRPWCARCW